MNLFPRAATAVTETRLHPAYLHHKEAANSRSPSAGESHSFVVTINAFAELVDRDPGRYVNGLSLENFVSDFGDVAAAHMALEFLKKMRVYRVEESDAGPALVPCKSAKVAKTCIASFSLNSDQVALLKKEARETGKNLSSVMRSILSQHYNLGK